MIGQFVMSDEGSRGATLVNTALMTHCHSQGWNLIFLPHNITILISHFQMHAEASKRFSE